MVKNHLKRIRSPSTWAIERKKTKFIAKPRPGGQILKYTLPLSVILKENLKLFTTAKELKIAIQKKAIQVNQKPRTELRFPVGLFDTISIPDLKLNYLLIINRRGKLVPLPIKENKTKLGKIVDKHILKGKKTQLRMNDGRHILIDKDTYSVGDTLKIELPTQKIIEHYPLQKGATVYITKGSHTGKIVTITDIKNQNITFAEENTHRETKKEYIIIIADAYPELQQ